MDLCFKSPPSTFGDIFILTFSSRIKQKALHSEYFNVWRLILFSFCRSASHFVKGIGTDTFCIEKVFRMTSKAASDENFLFFFSKAPVTQANEPAIIEVDQTRADLEEEKQTAEFFTLFKELVAKLKLRNNRAMSLEMQALVLTATSSVVFG